MTNHTIYIPQLWNQEAETVSGVSESWVKTYTATELAKLNNTYLKTDGTNSMNANLDFNSNELDNVTKINPPNLGANIEVDGSFDMKNYNLFNIQGLNAASGIALKLNDNVEMGGDIDLKGNEIINPKVPQSDNALALVKTVKDNREVFEPLFHKDTSNIFPVAGQIASSSSYYLPWGNSAKPDNAFDDNPKTQWVTGTGGRRSWIKVELPNPIQIWKVEFHPRLGHQQTTQLFTTYWFEASTDDTNYDRLLESQLQIDNVRPFEIPVTRPYKYFKFEGDGRSTMGLAEIKMYEATLVTRNYVTQTISDSVRYIPALALGGGIIRNSNNELELDTNVYLESPIISRGFIPFVSSNFINSQSSLELNSTGHLINAKFGNNADLDYNNIINLNIPVNPDDAANKSYVDNLVSSSITSFVTLPTVETLIALPGIPVVNGLVMTFIPTIKNVDVGVNNYVQSITDPFTNLTLTAPSPQRAPVLDFSSDHLYHLKFITSELREEKVSVSDVGGTNGNTTTFFFIAVTRKLTQQSHFNWIKQTGTNAYDNNTRLGVHLPWSNSRVYVDHGAVTGGRSEEDFTGQTSRILNKRVLWSYVRNGSNSTIYLDGNVVKTTTGLTTIFNPADVGRFTLGNGNNTSNYAEMDFYGLMFYNRALISDEMVKMNLYLKNYFKI